MCSTVTAHRRALHRIPELDDQLPETLRYLRSQLEALPCRISSPIPGSLCAFFDAGQPETAAFRADLDALPVQEATGLPFASCHPGQMHACGHDGHAAMALALSERLPALLPRLRRNVLVIFQPAEETTGGAGRLCQTGLLEQLRVTRIFGLHLWPGLPTGQIFTRPGALMARANEVTVRVTGQSVHLSRAQQGRDAMLAGIEYLHRAYAMVDALPPEEPRAFRFGKLVSGSVRNAISGSALLEGSLRTYREDTYRHCRSALESIGHQVAEEERLHRGGPFERGLSRRLEPRGAAGGDIREAGPEAPGLLEAPALAAEDFSFYQQRVPGVFFFLGTGSTPELHAPDFTFDDEAVLPKGAAFLESLALLD